MRLLLLFGGLCALLLGVCGYMLAEHWRRAPDPVTRPGAAAPAAHVPAHPAPAAESSPPPGAPAPRAPTTAALVPGEIRWADTAARDVRQRRLQQLTATLRATDIPPEVLRAELQTLAGQGQWADALVAVDRLLEAHPDDGDLLFERAAILLRLRRHVPAVITLNRLIAQQPGHARGWFNLAVAHQALGHAEDARRAWDRAIDLQPTPAAYAQRGALRLDAGEWAAAATDFEAVLQTEPHAPDAVLNVALAYWRLERRDDARRVLADFLRAQPNHIPALNRLAAFTWAAAETTPDSARLRAAAAELCRRSLALDPRQPEMQSLLADATTGPP